MDTDKIVDEAYLLGLKHARDYVQFKQNKSIEEILVYLEDRIREASK